ncbi:hypothetical protein V2G26_014299 [Clonostachys chloroleuca]
MGGAFRGVLRSSSCSPRPPCTDAPRARPPTRFIPGVIHWLLLLHHSYISRFACIDWNGQRLPGCFRLAGSQDPVHSRLTGYGDQQQGPLHGGWVLNG